MKRGLLEKPALKGMEFTLRGDSLDGIHPGAFGFRGQNETCADQATIQLDAACTAIPGATTLLGACLMKNVPKDIEEGLPIVAKKFQGLAIDNRGDVSLHVRINSLLVRQQSWLRAGPGRR